MSSEIYKLDLENRFPTYTFTESTVGNRDTCVVKDGDGKVKLSITGGNGTTKIVRENLVGDNEILPVITSTQKNALVDSIAEGTQIAISTTNTVETYINSAWR